MLALRALANHFVSRKGRRLMDDQRQAVRAADMNWMILC
jgi:hypothetical protein